MGRAFIFTTISETLNRKLEIKVNGVVYSIRVLEEPSGDNFNKFYTDWKCQQSMGDSTDDDDDSNFDSDLAVPETMFSEDVGVDDLQRLHDEFSNMEFGKVVNIEERTGGSGKVDVGKGDY